MLLALVFTLLPYQDQPLPSLPYHISINTLISVLTTVMKACSLVVLAEGLGQLKWEYFKTRKPLRHLVSYDTATRGPWGCLQLLASLRGQSFLATLGAAASILIIGVDPFAQQLIVYYSCNVPSTKGAVASIPRTSYYNESTNSGVSDPNSNSLFQVQKNAIVNGFFNPGTIQVPADCKTGNCTYSSTYTTVGFCSDCVDVTKELSSFWTTLLYDPGTGAPTSTGRRAFNTTLPSGLNTFIYDTNEALDLYFNIRTQGATTEMLLGKNPDQHWYVDRYASCESNPEGCCAEHWEQNTWGCRGEGAARCTITPCVKTLQGSVESGVLKETVVATYTDWFVGSPYAYGWQYDQYVMADLSCVTDETRGNLKTLGFEVSASRFMPYNILLGDGDGRLMELAPDLDKPSNATLSEAQMSLIPKECIYQMDGFLIYSVGNFLEDYLTTQVTTSSGANALLGNAQALSLLNNTYISIDSVREAFAGIAHALSVRARQWNSDGSGTYNVPAKGILIVTETCIKVHWPWLIYPASIVLLTLCFVIAVLVQTETAEDGFARGWKNSILPLIYHGISGSSKDDDAGGFRTTDIRCMDKAAKKDTGSITLGSVHGAAMEMPPLLPRSP